MPPDAINFRRRNRVDSGLAIGTLAVLGIGPDWLYPAENRSPATRIGQCGAV